MIECIGAVTLATHDMARAVRFFHLTDHDGHELSFAWPVRDSLADQRPT
jgi:hypothetical protein